MRKTYARLLAAQQRGRERFQRDRVTALAVVAMDKYFDNMSRLYQRGIIMTHVAENQAVYQWR